jgi:hypothetical protein
MANINIQTSWERYAIHTEPDSDALITHYSEITRDSGIGTPIALSRSLPCCITKGRHVCGRGATVGSVTPNADGTWTLIPICEICLKEIVEIYGAISERR